MSAPARPWPERTGTGPATVAVCIVNWNTRDHLERCLAALPAACEGLRAEVVVVDNASGDGSAGMVRERFPGVRLIALERNLGFAAGNNLALAETRADWLLLLNPDIHTPPGSVRALVEAAAGMPGPAGVGAALVGHDGAVQSSMYRRFPSRAQVLLYLTALRFASRRLPALAHRYLDVEVSGAGPILVDQLPGACCLLPRAIVEHVGPMDPDYFIWYEDVDWCYRIRRAGYPLYVLPAVRMLHAGGASFQSWSQARQLRQSFLALFRFLSKFRHDALLDWTAGVLCADLALEEAAVRLVGAAPGGRGRGMPSREALRDLRHELRAVVAAHHQGRLLRLTPDGPVFDPAPPRGADGGGVRPGDG